MALTCPGLDCHARCRRRWTVTHPLLPLPQLACRSTPSGPAGQRLPGLRTRCTSTPRCSSASAHLRRDAAAQVHSYAEMQQRLELGRQLAPHLQGASETWQANLCIGWPVKPVNPPHPFHVRGVPTLIIHAVHDPSVHYSWAHGLAAQIDGSALLTRTGDGHTSIYTSECARSAAEAFLVETQTEANRVCDG